MKNYTHLNYLKSFKYLQFFKTKTYQYFEPLIKLFAFFKKDKQNPNGFMDKQFDISSKQATLFLINEEFRIRLEGNVRPKRVSLYYDSMDISTNTNHLNIVDNYLLERMSKVRAVA